jgi:outer membrane protein TolC
MSGWLRFSLLILAVLALAPSTRAEPRDPSPGKAATEECSLGGMIQPPATLWVVLLRQEAVQKDLQITDQQQAALRQMGATCAAKMREYLRSLEIARPSTKEERQARLAAVRQQMAAQAERVSKDLGQVLSPSQTGRLKQIGCQVRGALALDDREVQQALGMQPQQSERFAAVYESILRGAPAVPDQGPQDAAENSQSREKNAEKRLMGVLSPTQQAKFDELKGRKVEMDLSRLRDRHYRWLGPKAIVANHWVDASDVRVREEPDDLSKWWTALDDRVLDRLITAACTHNPSLQQARDRALRARAQTAVAEQQPVSGRSWSDDPFPVFAVDFSAPGNLAFDFAWELDFWSRFPIAEAAADDGREAAAEDYGDLLVALLADVAGGYVQVRTVEERLRALRECIAVQRSVLQSVEVRFKMGYIPEIDLTEARSGLAESEARKTQLEVESRQATNRLCVLLGKPPVDLAGLLGAGPTPTVPPEVAAGIPADLLRRRPDVRRAERRLSARAEAIGIAWPDLDCLFIVTGSLVSRLPLPAPGTPNPKGIAGPTPAANLLATTPPVRHANSQDQRLKELVVAYQNTVLRAGEELENGLAVFLQGQSRARYLAEGVSASRKSVDIVIEQYKAGMVDFRRCALLMEEASRQQDLLAEARGQVAQGLVQIYRALGGGWQVRLAPAAPAAIRPTVLVPSPLPPAPAPPAPHAVPGPLVPN